MRNLSNEQQLKALSARLRFLQKRIWNMEKCDSQTRMRDLIQELAKEIQNHFGPKIAREIFWSVEEK